MALRYFPAARADIKNALIWTAENFGEPAVERYQRLIGIAIAEIVVNPELTHSYQVQGLQRGIRLYHLKHSRTRAGVKGVVVKNPRHFVAYTIQGADLVVVRVLHDRMEITNQLKDSGLQRALPSGVLGGDSGG